MSSSETQVQIVGARESLNGRKNMARRHRSDFWLVPENFCVFLPISSRIRHRNALTEKAWKDVVQGPDSRGFKISLWRGVTTATWGENHSRWRHHPTCDAAFSPSVALFFGRTKRLLTHARAGSVHNAAYIAISGKVVGKSAREYPERYCGLLWVHCFSKKFERMTREAMDVCLRVLKESSKSRFDSYIVRNSVLIISHITFWDCRMHIFSDNISR